jgi:hypothetical protein
MAKQLHIVLQDDGSLRYETAEGTSYPDVILMCALTQQYAFYDMQMALLKRNAKIDEEKAA